MLEVEFYPEWVMYEQIMQIYCGVAVSVGAWHSVINSET
jgi:hypothetical protein